MREADIPFFVQAVIDTGCDICAVGQVGCVLGDADPTPQEQDGVEPRLREITEMFSDREHLHPKIIAYLRSIDRYVEI
jgi:hypothetical protein